MKCREIKKRLIPFLESGLSEREQLIVEAHLYVCDACRKEKELLERTWSMLDGSTPPPVSADFTSKVMAKIREQQDAKPGSVFPDSVTRLNPRVLVPVLISACVLIAVYFVVRNQPAHPPHMAAVIVPEERAGEAQPETAKAEPAKAETAKAETEKATTEIAAAEEVEVEQATVTYVAGSVTVLLSGQQEPVQVETGMTLEAGDTVTTGSDGSMEISFDPENNKIVRVQADTTATMTFNGSEKMLLSVGEVFATINALPVHSAFEIRTPTAVSGARGTSWTTTVNAEGTTVESFERTPYIKNIEADGRVSDVETKVETGYYTVVAHAQKPQPVRQIPPERVTRYGSLKDDIRRHAGEDLIMQKNRPKFNRDDFIRRSMGDKAARPNDGQPVPRGIPRQDPERKEIQRDGQNQPRVAPDQQRSLSDSKNGQPDPGRMPGPRPQKREVMQGDRQNQSEPRGAPGPRPQKREEMQGDKQNQPGPRRIQGPGPQKKQPRK